MTDARRVFAFPRGINVGGNNLVAMADLRGALERTGFADVATVLASGNVSVTTALTLARARAAIEIVLQTEFSIDTIVLCFEADDVRAMVDAYPWDPTDAERQHYAILMDDTAIAREILETTEVKPAAEALATAPLGLYYWAFKGRTTAGKIQKTLDVARFKAHYSVRAIATLKKLLAT